MRKRGVQVPDVHLTVLAARVDVARVGAAGRREVAADEGAQDRVAAEGDERVIVGVGEPVVVVVPAVVKIRVVRVLRRVELGEAVRRHDHAQVPELHGLVLAVAEDVATVALAVEVR